MKQGKFVGKKNLVITQSEKDEFTALLKSVCKELGVKYTRIKFETSEGNFHWFSIKLKKHISYRKNNGDKVLGLSKIDYMFLSQHGFETYEQGQACDWDETKYNQREYSVYIKTDAMYHKYKKHYKNNFRFEGRFHYDYDTEISGFYNQIKANMLDVLNY